MTTPRKGILEKLKHLSAMALLTGATVGIVASASAQAPKTVDEAVNVRELRRLLDVARESGFTEDEVRKITVEYNGEVINVWEFLARLEEEKAQKEARDKAMREKPYHTVQDVFQDLEKGQPKDLEKLRKDFRFNQ